MRSVFQPQVVHLAVEERDKMVSRNPSGVDQKFHKGDIRIVAENHPMAEVVEHDHLENEESSQSVLSNVWDQNPRQ